MPQEHACGLRNVGANAYQLSVTGRDKQVVFSLVAAGKRSAVADRMLPAGNILWHGDNASPGGAPGQPPHGVQVIVLQSLAVSNLSSCDHLGIGFAMNRFSRSARWGKEEVAPVADIRLWSSELWSLRVEVSATGIILRLVRQGDERSDSSSAEFPQAPQSHFQTRQRLCTLQRLPSPVPGKCFISCEPTSALAAAGRGDRRGRGRLCHSSRGHLGSLAGPDRSQRGRRMPSRGPGKFNYPEEMKTVQETILEVAKSRSVLAGGPAARSARRPTARDPAAWPTDRDIVDARKYVKLVPPKGAEFGKTEVFYLNVRAEDRARSVGSQRGLFKQLQVQFQQLRDAKAQSMVDELTKTVHLAKTDLDEATAALAATEHRVGSDLAELRSMQEMASSDSALRRSGEDIRANSARTPRRKRSTGNCSPS